MDVATESLTRLESERLINSLVIPRPIAWITTIDGGGQLNLAPFSYFNVVSGGTPPVVMVSFSPKGPKHTLANLVATGEFVVNVVGEGLREAMIQSSAEYAAEIDEVAVVGLHTAPSAVVGPPRLAAAPAALECRLIETKRIDEFVVAFGRVVQIHVADDVVVSGRPDPSLIRAVGRLGGSLYTTVSDVYRLRRPAEGGPSAR
jgi:flavin reductase (DIM6/NTAB) family NADH-FMN oxidoreductase RutF